MANSSSLTDIPGAIGRYGASSAGRLERRWQQAKAYVAPLHPAPQCGEGRCNLALEGLLALAELGLLPRPPGQHWDLVLYQLHLGEGGWGGWE